MANLVPQMTEQRAIGFVQLFANSFALGVVGFLDVDGDDPVGVARQNARAHRRRTEKIESQAALDVLVHARFYGETERNQR